MHWRTFASFIFWGIGDNRTGHCWLRLLGTRRFFLGKSNWSDSRCQLKDKLYFFRESCLHFAFCPSCTSPRMLMMIGDTLLSEQIKHEWQAGCQLLADEQVGLSTGRPPPRLSYNVCFGSSDTKALSRFSTQFHTFNRLLIYVWVLPAQNLHVLSFRF